MIGHRFVNLHTTRHTRLLLPALPLVLGQGQFHGFLLDGSHAGYSGRTFYTFFYNFAQSLHRALPHGLFFTLPACDYLYLLFAI